MDKFYFGRYEYSGAKNKFKRIGKWIAKLEIYFGVKINE